MSGILDIMSTNITRPNLYPQALTDAMKDALGDRALLTASKEPLLEQLVFLADIQKSVNHQLPKTIKMLRNRGASWQEIADALGVSRQAAHERWAR